MSHQSLSAARWRQQRHTIITILRIACGVLCIYDAWQKWQPGFAGKYLAELQQASSSQFPLTATWFTCWFSLAHLDIYAFTSVIAIIEIGLAIGLICGMLTNLACYTGTVLALSGCIGSGYISGAAIPTLDYGVIIIALLSFIGLIISNAGQPFGVDNWLSPRYRRWTLLMSHIPQPAIRQQQQKTAEQISNDIARRRADTQISEASTEDTEVERQHVSSM